VTGAPGAGKSSLVNQLATRYRSRGQTVGIVAVDPTSPFSGGAILGDRIRMQGHSGDPGIFIRSMATRGSLGGLAQATADVVKLVDAAGYDIIIIETVGAGQAEVEIARTAHTTIVIEAPGLGDDIQAIKAGILEIADIFVVNKADRDGADAAALALESMLGLNGSAAPARGHHGVFANVPQFDDSAGENWRPPICKTVAITGEGVDELVQALEAHRAYLSDSGRLPALQCMMAAMDLETILEQALRKRVLRSLQAAEAANLIEQVARRRLDPYAAVDQLVRSLPDD
jgi:LAO/AO transport system kinase